MRLPDIDYGATKAVKPFINKDNSVERNLQLTANAVNQYVKVKDADDDLKAFQAAQELAVVDETLSNTLLTQNAINLNENTFSINANETMKSNMSEDEKTLYGETGLVPTETVIAPAYDQSMRDAYDVITEGMSDSQKEKVKMRFAPQYAKTVGDLTKRKIDLEVGRLKYGYQETYDSAIRNGDVVGAQQIAQSAVAAGAWTPEYHYKQMEEGRENLIVGKYLQELNGAQTEDDVQKILHDTMTNVQQITPKTARQMMSDTNTYLSNMSKQREERYREGDNIMAEQALTGTLSTESLMTGLKGGYFSPDKVIATNSKLQAARNAPIKSSPEIMQEWNRRVAAIPNTSGGDTTLTQNVDTIVNGAILASTGIDPKRPNAPFQQPSITGAEAQKIIKDARRAGAAAARPAGFTDGMRLIRNLTNTSDSTETDTSYKNDAFQDFYSGYIQYINREGVNADPVQWVQDNKEKYTPEIYVQEKENRFLSQFPEYNQPQFVDLVPEKVGKMTEMTPRLNRDKVLHFLKVQDDAKAIPVKEIEQQYYLLTGKFTGGTLEQLMNQENQDDFNDQINDVNSEEEQ